ncbi:MAG: hypothetical protein NVS9B15_13380 [Acidobacteriaceae bacterium]
MLAKAVRVKVSCTVKRGSSAALRNKQQVCSAVDTSGTKADMLSGSNIAQA